MTSIVGNLLPFFPVALAIDIVTGAAWRLEPELVRMELIKKKRPWQDSRPHSWAFWAHAVAGRQSGLRGVPPAVRPSAWERTAVMAGWSWAECSSKCRHRVRCVSDCVTRRKWAYYMTIVMKRIATCAWYSNRQSFLWSHHIPNWLWWSGAVSRSYCGSSNFRPKDSSRTQTWRR